MGCVLQYLCQKNALNKSCSLPLSVDEMLFASEEDLFRTGTVSFLLLLTFNTDTGFWQLDEQFV